MLLLLVTVINSISNIYHHHNPHIHIYFCFFVRGIPCSFLFFQNKILVCLARRSEFLHHVSLWSPTSRRIFPCVNRPLRTLTSTGRETRSRPHYLTLKFVQPLWAGFPLVSPFSLTTSTSLCSHLLARKQALPANREPLDFHFYVLCKAAVLTFCLMIFILQLDFLPSFLPLVHM